MQPQAGARRSCGAGCRSTVATADLHDALEDARQLPIIAAGLHRVGGDDWSIEALAGSPLPTTPDAKTTKPLVDSFANIAAARHMSMLRKIGVAPPTPRQAPASAAAAAPPPPKVTGKARNRTVELSQAAHLAVLSDDDAASTAPRETTASVPDTPATQSGPDSTTAGSVSSSEGNSRRPRALEEMLLAQRTMMEPDPFLTVTCASRSRSASRAFPLLASCVNPDRTSMRACADGDRGPRVQARRHL